jgi:hypothetical protein
LAWTLGDRASRETDAGAAYPYRIKVKLDVKDDERCSRE